jgi:hypothetical protein
MLSCTEPKAWASADSCQETVDKSPTFAEMLVDLEKWMKKWDLLDERGALKDAVWVSDGVSSVPPGILAAS